MARLIDAEKLLLYLREELGSSSMAYNIVKNSIEAGEFTPDNGYFITSYGDRIPRKERLEGYELSVMRSLINDQGIEPRRAAAMMLLYYDHLLKTWGKEPNVEDMAQEIIRTDRIVNQIEKVN